jgi:hypothetical protein
MAALRREYAVSTDEENMELAAAIDLFSINNRKSKTVLIPYKTPLECCQSTLKIEDTHSKYIDIHTTVRTVKKDLKLNDDQRHAYNLMEGAQRTKYLDSLECGHMHVTFTKLNM